jgi:acyl transferase domain-containing protein
MSRASLTNQYWVDNMCNTVIFAGALTRALQHVGSFDLAIEVGPHPALKGPATAVMEVAMSEANVPYTGLLCRGQGDIEQISAALGFIWTQLGFDSVQFGAPEALLSGTQGKRVLSDLPPYPFDHQRTYLTSNRLANHFKHRSAFQAPNPVLGTPCAEASTPGEMSGGTFYGQVRLPGSRAHAARPDHISRHGLRKHGS